ncbi:[Citrate [pro-3S]-lyase] ligase [Fibrobacteria bacterium R8-3-H12]
MGRTIFKNWQDFESSRNSDIPLAIYGAGVAGKHFLMVNKVIPNYFCDKNAKEIKSVNGIPCLTFAELKNLKTADILVAITNTEINRELFRTFSKIKGEINYTFYFYHNFCIETLNNYQYAKNVYINNELVFNGKVPETLFPNWADLNNISDEELLKFKDAWLNVNSAKKIRDISSNEMQFKNNVFKVSNNFKLHSTHNPFSVHKRTIFFFGLCPFVSLWSQSKYSIEHILSNKIMKANLDFQIKNFAFCNVGENMIKFQIAQANIKQNDIVFVAIQGFYYALLINYINSICNKLNAKLIIYEFPTIFHKKNLSKTEKYIIKNTNKKWIEEYKNRELNFEQNIDKLISSGFEVYIPPREFFENPRTIHVDISGWHFADRGNKIIAEHLFKIVTGKAQKPNFFIDRAKERVKIGLELLPLVVKDIYVVISDLLRKKKNCENCGSIVMNCNPFTFGHLHLIEYAARQCEHLYIFVVQEDKSEFSFCDRFKLVKKNTEHLKNISVLPSTKFIISSQTFGDYFVKQELNKKESVPDVSLDLLIFACAIAPTLNIKKRFVGEEPLDAVTKHYNQEMKKLLPEYGCEVVEIKRKKIGDSVISASRVRKLLKERNFEEIRKIVPEATFKYLKNNSTRTNNPRTSSCFS